ncbi:LPXTG cell wall anchor domain-containing protein [Candidatus Soleaferrea massiliensis]|uniref:LPXTG cell wall anchor domain-containing protein n=1 Tax=Candidatus Soleaferrea massiliensis TaxID=1470354 RepID=UPI00058F61D8|nr:LPXTG cell wall anchor domain-containing protein [Candidatus Soleaferrea massiliensis]
MSCVLPVSAQNSSNVSYEGRAKSFVFLPSDDLFQNFKTVVPGDRKVQEINLQNGGRETIRMYLCAQKVGRDQFTTDQQFEISNELIDVMGLKLVLTTVDGKEKLIYSGPASGVPSGAADETGTMEKNINLGTYRPGAKAKITAYLYIPTWLDNRYQRAVSKIDWIFSCIIPDEVEIPDEETPLGPPPKPEEPPLDPPFNLEEPPTDDVLVNPPIIEILDDEVPLASPNTGDQMGPYLMLAIILVILAAAAIVWMIVKRRKNK